MPRPALIVGLGGTGQWVLTWLKRDLQLSSGGTMPKNVRLLEVDTATKLEAGAEQIIARDGKEEKAVVGGVTLGDGEFIYVGGDSRPIAERVKDGRYPQIGQWYHAARWLDTQMPATFILDDGAGRLRQFGRLAVFKDILGQETNSRIWRALHTAIEGVRSSTDEQRRLEIIVVGSFAGGTGSGMFIDIALILRMLAQQMGVHHVLRGFFALPSVFTNQPDNEMKARTFAAWRELNRFMVVNSDFPMPLVEYVQDNSNFRIRPTQRIFDACYLVDGKRNGQPLAEEAKYGVFPMMSEVISAFLDEQAGTAYTQWIFTNLAPEYARRPETPMYSAVGAFTVQVPAHFVQEESSHEFAKDVLLRVLSPRQKPDDNARLVASGAERHLALAASNQNQEDPGFAGRQRSLGLLSSPVERDGKTARPTKFLGRIRDVLSKAVDNNQRGQTVDQLARAGSADLKSAAAVASWVSYFPDLGDDPSFAAVRRNVEEHMSYSIRAQYGRREGEKEDEARPRLRNIPEDVRKRFGGITSNNQEIEEYYGTCGDALLECQRSQLIIFRHIIRLNLTNILMGKSEDPVMARTGKLGYAWDYFDGLVEDLEKFLSIMEDVKKKRDEIKPELKFAGLSDRARRLVEATTGKKIFWFIESPRVREAEQAYLDAQQRLVEVRREDILHIYVVNTVRQMKDIVVETRNAIQKWIWHLSTGDDASQIPGLWDGVRQSLLEVKSAHSFDTQAGKVQRQVADMPLPHTEADVSEALRKWEWDVRFDTDAMAPLIQVKILADTPGEEPAKLSNPDLETSGQVRLEIGVRNRQAFMGLARRRFAGEAVRTTVADQIKQEYPNPSIFALTIANVSAEPLFDGDPEANPRVKSNLIRVQAQQNDPYFIGADGIEGHLRGIHSLDRTIRDDKYGIQVVGSENPYKLTLVRTDDLYQFNHYSAWEECLRAYAQHMDQEGQPLDPVLMHNFAAEARAVQYERRITRDGKDYNSLHPRVVMLLENTEALQQFVYLGMLGLISEEDDNRSYRWELNWELRSGPQNIWLTPGWAIQDENRRPKPTIFHALHGYVVMGINQKEGRRDRIDYEFARTLIEREQSRLTPKGEKKLIQENLREDGFVGWLKSFGYDPDVPDRIAHPEYADLATIIEMMLGDRLEKLNKLAGDNSRSGSGSGSTKSPFRTAQSTESRGGRRPSANADEGDPKGKPSSKKKTN